MPSVILGVVATVFLVLHLLPDKYEILPNSYGHTSVIYRLPGDPPKICKSINPDCTETHFPVEKEAYERFSAHDPPKSILAYYGVHDTIPSGIVLELAEEGNLHDYIRAQKEGSHPRSPRPATLYRWAAQATEALEFAHSLGVYNSDIHPVNFFLGSDLDLKVGDWAGASIDGGKSHSSYRYRHRLFDANGTDVPGGGITAQTEVFAMGSALYYMAAGHDAWPELEEPEDRDEIRRRIQGKMWPDLGALPLLADVIAKCWNLEFESMREVRRAVLAERDRSRLASPRGGGLQAALGGGPRAAGAAVG